MAGFLQTAGNVIAGGVRTLWNNKWKLGFGAAAVTAAIRNPEVLTETTKAVGTVANGVVEGVEKTAESMGMFANLGKAGMGSMMEMVMNFIISIMGMLNPAAADAAKRDTARNENKDLLKANLGDTDTRLAWDQTAVKRGFEAANGNSPSGNMHYAVRPIAQGGLGVESAEEMKFLATKTNGKSLESFVKDESKNLKVTNGHDLAAKLGFEPPKGEYGLGAMFGGLFGFGKKEAAKPAAAPAAPVEKFADPKAPIPAYQPLDFNGNPAQEWPVRGLTRGVYAGGLRAETASGPLPTTVGGLEDQIRNEVPVERVVVNKHDASLTEYRTARTMNGDLLRLATVLNDASEGKIVGEELKINGRTVDKHGHKPEETKTRKFFEPAGKVFGHRGTLVQTF
jgi:hypothetical protein